MAKAILHIEKQVPNAAEEQAQALKEVLQSVADNKDAVTMFMKVLKEAHETGLLEMLHGLLAARHEVGYLAIKQLNQPSMHRMIKNAMGAVGFLGQIDTNQLQQLMSGVSHGIQRMSESAPNDRPGGILGLAKMLRDPDLMAAMHTMSEFARGMGEHLRQSNASGPEHARG